MQPAVTPEEASILQKNHVFLLTNLPYEPVKDYLFQEGILSLHDLDELQALNIPKYQNEKIIKMLYRHPKGYSTLLHFLKDPANKVDWIANELCAKDAPQWSFSTYLFWVMVKWTMINYLQKGVLLQHWYDKVYVCVHLFKVQCLTTPLVDKLPWRWLDTFILFDVISVI